MAQVKEKNQTEPLPAQLEYLIRNLLDEQTDHWRRQGYRDRITTVKQMLDAALATYEQQGKKRK